MKEAKKATVFLHPGHRIGEISPRLFGAFIEPIGTIVDGSMYNPKHVSADELGFRTDFLQAVRETGLPAVRLPGGNFVSGWNWKDSIGPVENRKKHLDLAWFQYITNQVGHDEYLRWSEKAGTEPMYTINLGTGGIEDAIDIAAYTNHPGGEYWSDLRQKNGHEKPYGVKIWYLGNEMDGPWQIGSWEKAPRGYGVLANEVSKAMKWVDPTIETVACVSSSPNLSHYPQWDMDVLEQCYESVDYISLHHYHAATPDNLPALMGGSVYFENYINTEIALCDFLQAKLRSPRKMMLSFDEYATILRPAEELHPGYGPHAIYAAHYRFDQNREYVLHDPDHMEGARAPKIPQMMEALTNTSTLMAFLRHADRVKIGCMTSGLAALARTDREHVWKPAGYYPYEDMIRHATGVSLRPLVTCDCFDIPGYAMDDNSQYQTQRGVPYIDAAAAYDEEKGEMTVYIINRSWEEDFEIDLDVSHFHGYTLKEHVQMYSEDPQAGNTWEDPEKVKPSVSEAADFKDGRITSVVKKLSWNAFRLVSADR